MTTKQLAVNEQQEQLVLQRDEEITDISIYIFYLCCYNTKYSAYNQSYIHHKSVHNYLKCR